MKKGSSRGSLPSPLSLLTPFSSRLPLTLLSLSLLPLLVLSSTRGWSEQDENDRIAAIMAEEKRAFDEEMKSAQQMRYKQEYRRMYGGSLQLEEDDWREEGRRKKGRTERVDEVHASALRLPPASPSPPPPTDSWCYHCASPLGLLSSNSRRAVQQFLDVRRTTFPKTAVTRECLAPKNLTALQKEVCKHKYCQTLVLMDHDEGSSFVMRGCAEHFGAIDTEMLEAREDNSCIRLHDKLDIRECICRERKSCYTGRQRGSSNDHLSLLLLPLSLLFALLL